MNKPKAPKDMSLGELLEEYKKERWCAHCKYDSYCAGKEPAFFGRGESLPNCSGGRIWMERKMCEPAPNPFTPDQLATMRELQRNGFGYAAKDPCDTVFAYENEPEQDEDGYWTAEKDGGNYIELPFEFLAEVLDSEDKKPLCFSDYAPLEGADDV